MKQKTTPISVERALGLSIISVVLMDLASKTLKEENDYCPRNVKNWIRQWKEISIPMLFRVDKLKKLLIDKETVKEINDSLGYELEGEALENDLNVESTLFSNFIFLYLKSSTPEIYDLNLYVENLLQRKKLYTEEEVEDKLKALTKQVTVANYDTKFYKQFLTH